MPRVFAFFICSLLVSTSRNLLLIVIGWISVAYYGGSGTFAKFILVRSLLDIVVAKVAPKALASAHLSRWIVSSEILKGLTALTAAAIQLYWNNLYLSLWICVIGIGFLDRFSTMALDALPADIRKNSSLAKINGLGGMAMGAGNALAAFSCAYLLDQQNFAGCFAVSAGLGFFAALAGIYLVGEILPTLKDAPKFKTTANSTDWRTQIGYGAVMVMLYLVNVMLAAYVNEQLKEGVFIFTSLEVTWSLFGVVTGLAILYYGWHLKNEAGALIFSAVALFLLWSNITLVAFFSVAILSALFIILRNIYLVKAQSVERHKVGAVLSQLQLVKTFSCLITYGCVALFNPSFKEASAVCMIVLLFIGLSTLFKEKETSHD